MVEAEEFARQAWETMCDLYSAPAVPQVCLQLQDRYDVDVPLLLLLLHADRHEFGADTALVASWLTQAAEWREDVVKPLRRIRQTMKSLYTEQDERQLRDAVKALELRAEQLHVHRLARSLKWEIQRQQGHQMADVYLRSCNVPDAERATALTFFRDETACLNRKDGNKER
ncbi:TIGR02444 family protein [Agrobacterium sp. SORGH_AS 787]|uniref:TIGR02444 family protein n=1 Tax=Agrobacterium sp. SORGH_AS 787 TaxID=3041775 RepID=UPI002789B07B|nr:uncharacterized protein (TIGR02444 family) [Rhizobium sp. SORGH_AS_0787]